MSAKNLTFSKPLYAILDGKDVDFLRRLGLFILQTPSLPVCALQIRAKHLNAKDFAHLTQTLVEKHRELPHSPPLIVNDHLDIAREFDLNLHIGQNDCDFEKARSVLGEAAIIGVSTHNLQQAQSAERAGANYIGFGPLFPTASKENALSPREHEDLKNVLKNLSIPVVGIGGITPERWPELRILGLKHFAMIQGLLNLGLDEFRYRDIAV